MKKIKELSGIDLQELEASIYKDSYFEFLQAFWGTVCFEPYIHNWHIERLCYHLQKIGKGIINRESKAYDLCVNVPPSSSKSIVICQLFPVWLWINDPSIRIISSSHSNQLSMSHAVKSRDCIKSDLFQKLFPYIELKPDQDNKSHYLNTLGGERLAVSVSSKGTTGFHAHLILCDDLQNPQTAQSEVERIQANRHLTDVLSSRKIDEEITPTILVMQRLHDEDCTTKFLEIYPSAKQICLPATIDFPILPKSYVKYYEDGLFDAKRKSKKILEAKKKVLGSQSYAAQYGQQPAPLEGNILKDDWFGRYLLEETLLKLNPTIHFYLDTAYTKDSKNDPSALLAFFIDGQNHNLYLKHCVAVHLEFPQLINYIKNYVATHGDGYSKIIIEPKASGKSIVQQLQNETGLNVVEDVAPTDSKETRVYSIAPLVEAKRVHVPYFANWVTDFMNEVTVFPFAKHDDKVDCLTGAVRNTIAIQRARATPRQMIGIDIN